MLEDTSTNYINLGHCVEQNVSSDQTSVVSTNYVTFENSADVSLVNDIQTDGDLHYEEEEDNNNSTDDCSLVEMSVTEVLEFVNETDDVVEINAGVLQHFKRDQNRCLHLFQEITIANGAILKFSNHEYKIS